MRTYYRGPDAFVTADRFVWLGETPKMFPVRDLREIHLVENAAQRPAGVAVATGAGMLTFAGAAWLALGMIVGVAVSALAVSVVVVAVRSRRSWGGRSYRVVATVRGARTVIYEARDPRVFNQVTRALRRAVENDRRSPDDHRLVAAS